MHGTVPSWCSQNSDQPSLNKVEDLLCSALYFHKANYQYKATRVLQTNVVIPLIQNYLLGFFLFVSFFTISAIVVTQLEF